jgi:DNA repair exonuclease SbcCD ATPase subunit
MANRKNLEPLTSSLDASMTEERTAKRLRVESPMAIPDEEVVQQRFRSEPTGWASASTSECSAGRFSEAQDSLATIRTLHPAAEVANRALTEAYQQVAKWRDAATVAESERQDAAKRADTLDAAVARLQRQLAESERQVTEARNSSAQRQRDYEEIKAQAESVATEFWKLKAERDAHHSAYRVEANRASQAEADAAAERIRAEAASKRADEAEAQAREDRGRQAVWSEEYETLEARCDALQSQVTELRAQPAGFPVGHPVTRLGSFFAAPNGNGMGLVQLLGQLFPDPAHPAYVAASTLVSALSPPSSTMSPMDALFQLLRGLFESP